MRDQTLTRSVDTVSTLLLRTITDGSGQANQCRLVLLATSLGDRIVDCCQVAEKRLDSEIRERLDDSTDRHLGHAGPASHTQGIAARHSR